MKDSWEPSNKKLWKHPANSFSYTYSITFLIPICWKSAEMISPPVAPLCGFDMLFCSACTLHTILMQPAVNAKFFSLCACVCVCLRLLSCCVSCASLSVSRAHTTLTSSRSLSETKHSLIIQTTPSLSLTLSLSHAHTHTHTHTNPFKSPCVWISLTGVCSFCLVLSFIRSHTLGWNQKQGRRAFGNVCVHLQSVLPSILDTRSLNSILKLLRESQHGLFFA